MSEAVRIFLEVLLLGRSRQALLARAAFAEDRALMLDERAGRHRMLKPKKARRLYSRAAWWEDRCKVLKQRAEARR